MKKAVRRPTRFLPGTTVRPSRPSSSSCAPPPTNPARSSYRRRRASLRSIRTARRGSSSRGEQQDLPVDAQPHLIIELAGLLEVDDAGTSLRTRTSRWGKGRDIPAAWSAAYTAEASSVSILAQRSKRFVHARSSKLIELTPNA